MSSPTDVDATTVRSRRRFARRQWARRWLAWKYVLAVVLLVALIVGGLWTVYFSSVLAVKGVEVTGAQTISADEVRAAAAVPTGRPLARVDLGSIKSRVESLAVVKSADVSRKWPDQILIAIDERVAIAVVEIGGRLRGMDASGVVFRDYRKAPVGLPRVQTSTSTPAEALREAAKVISALPEALSTIVDHVEVETVDQISLVLRDGRVVRWGSADQSDEKARVLVDLLKQHGQVYDVSVPGQVTVSP
ncbi:FtsQ-type POTRA domain-containing protein [Nocardioides sp.]|uniref:cell division protein FtsQ/DivIB n=1 Tax=Nocardioides sp. TaxID=35761 RepID=UPI0031FE91C5|nr:FtsQ-type protein [Nocardioides sp.]